MLVFAFLCLFVYASEAVSSQVRVIFGLYDQGVYTVNADTAEILSTYDLSFPIGSRGVGLARNPDTGIVWVATVDEVAGTSRLYRLSPGLDTGVAIGAPQPFIVHGITFADGVLWAAFDVTPKGPFGWWNRTSGVITPVGPDWTLPAAPGTTFYTKWFDYFPSATIIDEVAGLDIQVGEVYVRPAPVGRDTVSVKFYDLSGFAIQAALNSSEPITYWSTGSGISPYVSEGSTVAPLDSDGAVLQASSGARQSLGVKFEPPVVNPVLSFAGYGPNTWTFESYPVRVLSGAFNNETNGKGSNSLSGWTGIGWASQLGENRIAPNGPETYGTVLIWDTVNRLRWGSTSGSVDLNRALTFGVQGGLATPEILAWDENNQILWTINGLVLAKYDMSTGLLYDARNIQFPDVNGAMWTRFISLTVASDGTKFGVVSGTIDLNPGKRASLTTVTFLVTIFDDGTTQLVTQDPISQDVLFESTTALAVMDCECVPGSTACLSDCTCNKTGGYLPAGGYCVRSSCLLYGCGRYSCYDKYNDTQSSYLEGERTCFCPTGTVVKGYGNSNSVTLPDALAFPGCIDLNECTAYGCGVQGLEGCVESTTDRTVPLNSRRCTCLEGTAVSGLPAPQPSIELVGNAPFEGCSDIVCGNGILGEWEICDSGIGCLDDCTCQNNTRIYFIPDNDVDCYGPLLSCGDGTLQAWEECDGTRGCLQWICTCDQASGWYPTGTGGCRQQEGARWFAIGNPDTFGFFWTSQYCGEVSVERRLTRFPWVTLGAMDCLEDPLDLGHFGLRTFPDGKWDSLEDMSFVVSFVDGNGITRSIINSEVDCQTRRQTIKDGSQRTNCGAEFIDQPGDSAINENLWWEFQDLSETILVRNVWNCTRMGCRRQFVVKNLSDKTITDLRVQLMIEYEITPTIGWEDMRFGKGVNDPSLESFAGIAQLRNSELTIDDQLQNFVTGADLCWTQANTNYDWPHIQPFTGSDTACLDSGCSAQFNLGSIAPHDFVVIDTDLLVFRDSLVADDAVDAMNPVFYCMGTHESDPREWSRREEERRVIATFTYSPRHCVAADGCVDLLPGDSPCVGADSELCDSWLTWECECDEETQWGPYCQHECLCENGGVCDKWTGECTCPEGYCGSHCQNECHCDNGVCDVHTCECFCEDTFHGKTCSRRYQCQDSHAETSVRG